MESTYKNTNGSAIELSRTEQDVTEISRSILKIFFDYALKKISHSKAGFEGGAQSFMPVVARFVAAGQRVEACLPAFPFKSANKVYKVLGKLPDKAEELALDRLNTICKRVQEVYPPGAQITIISDGITYNDLLCISDQDTWNYGEALRTMAIEKKFDNIGFSRMKDLLDFPLPEKMREIIYVANCGNFRRMLMNRYGNPDLDIDHEIATNLDTKLTYLGYTRFLESDLEHIFPQGANRSSNGYKRDCKYIAKQMLIRGHAFAGAVKNAFPNHLRLSIHESVGSVTKISISLLNTKTGFTTPWHCSVAQLADGEWVSAPMGEFSKEPRFELVHFRGVPSHFIERPDKSNSPFTGECMRKAKTLTHSEYLSRASTPSTTSTDGVACSNATDSPRAMNGKNSMLSSPSATSSIPEVTAEEMISNVNLSGDDMVTPTPYGRRLLPQIMDSLAAAEPSRTVFSLATTSGDSLSFLDISARAFTQAVDKTAWWLQGKAGKSASIQPVGYIGPHDLRYVLLTYACVKAGYAALFLSPKNNKEGMLAVLEATNCNIWVSASEVPPTPLVSEVLQKRPMNVLQLPSIETLLDAASVKSFPYTKTFDQAVNDPFCFLHTSGTTGVPKPIPWTHGLIGTMDAVRLLPPIEGDDGLLPWTSDWKAGDRIYSSFPMSHGAGIIMDILMPALYNLHCILGPTSAIPNINLVEALTESAKIDIWSMVPSLLDELGETPEVLARLKSSKFICASGGPVSPVSTGKVNEVIRVLNLTGTTEGLFMGNLVPSRKDWHWFSFHPSAGFEFKQLDTDTYEHWVHRNEGWSLFQGIFHTFSDKQSINFKDLYMRHPTKPNLWAFKGRSDDLIVLSNGYKITPLETEAYITTHPAVEGCLIFGTGKPQAGLLIELKDPSTKSEELFESIWKTVEEANSISRHKNQLSKNFLIFAQPDKPFYRTDKRTVKRTATLTLYADYIERFYSSRSDADSGGSTLALDMTSIESVQNGISELLRSSLRAAQRDIDPEANLFELGLDSIGVTSAVKAIQAATGLGDQIAPRHVYANPTISRLSATIVRMETMSKQEAGSSDKPVNDDVAKMKRMITQHKERRSFRLNAFDYVHQKNGMGMIFYLPLREGVSFQETFDALQAGLNRTLDLIPALGGKIMDCSEQEVGSTKGERSVSIPPLSMATSVHNRLIYKDLSDVLPSFAEMRAAGFPPSAVKESLVMRDDPFPKLPTDILVAQANFVTGGCLLAVEFNHGCIDGTGAFIAIRAWAENCRYLQGDESATCDWFHPESFNHSLPEIIHEQEGWARPLHEIDPGTWAFLPYFPDDEPTDAPETGPTGKADDNKPVVPAEISIRWRLPPRPKYPLHSIWPPPNAERCPKTTLFRISSGKLEEMKQEVIADPETKDVVPSISDIVQAFFWRAALRARYRVATEIHKQKFGPEEMAILELPTDGRPFFSELLPSTYMGSLMLQNRPTMPVEVLCSPATSVGSVAMILRQASARVSPSLVHDAFTILQSLPDHSRFSTAHMGLEHMHALLSNMMMFSSGDIVFGETFFANGGTAETMRTQNERHVGAFRVLLIFPMTKDGAVELCLGTHPEELDMLMTDHEFMRFADLVDGGY
ncbi:transferase family protein [Xylaria nigripes]|nr:transferase family protein [Xylaria nigripes]